MQPKELVENNSELNYHTRFPIVALITAAVIEHGEVPQSRVEVYRMRFDLMLSKWDRYREVKRQLINDPEGKRLFLQVLAFEVHSNSGRPVTFSMSEMRDLYEEKMGRWAYTNDFRDVLNDLVVANGVIKNNRGSKYSFGHISF